MSVSVNASVGQSRIKVVAGLTPSDNLCCGEKVEMGLIGRPTVYDHELCHSSVSCFKLVFVCVNGLDGMHQVNRAGSRSGRVSAYSRVPTYVPHSKAHNDSSL